MASDLLIGLAAVVQYRGIPQPNGTWAGPHKWTTMAAFDQESVAERYAENCGKNTSYWEYRCVKLEGADGQ